MRLSAASRRDDMGLHIGSQHRVDSRLVPLLFSQPFEKIRIQPDGNRFLGLRYYDPRLPPEFRVRWPRVGIARQSEPDLAVAHRPNAIPVGALFSLGALFSK